MSASNSDVDAELDPYIFSWSPGLEGESLIILPFRDDLSSLALRHRPSPWNTETTNHEASSASSSL